ncbi:MAG: M28 family metallopeptidase [Gammaproteobacteria bacterium]|nr:M28 family metallopeptidase [Gammaproteobacteria bacterium]
MRQLAAAFLCVAAASAAAAGTPDIGPAATNANRLGPVSRDRAQAALGEIAANVDPEQLQRTLERLVGFGTRHTASLTDSKVRGIGAARRWVRARFERIGAACGGCLVVESIPQVVAGKRFTKPTRIVDELGVQRGLTDPGRVVVISAHLDSRVSDVMNATADAPGADDDGSGVAAVLEAARVLSRHRFAATIVYAVLSGEEQGLYGGKLLAATARARGWRVEAQLNNDIVGNIHGQDGVIDNTHVRVFSEGTKSTETEQQAAMRRYNGGEVDSPSRNLARYMARLAPEVLSNLQVRMIYRTDRYDRGGDQVPMLAAGFPAVRVTEAEENYTRQHQDVRIENGIHYGDVIGGVDFPYLAQVTRLNAITLASLAWAPAPPAAVAISGAVTADTTLRWQAATGAAGYRVWWRETTAPQWQMHRFAGDRTRFTLRGINIDDYFFGVASVSADGFESPVEFPGPAGAF